MNLPNPPIFSPSKYFSCTVLARQWGSFIRYWAVDDYSIGSCFKFPTGPNVNKPCRGQNSQHFPTNIIIYVAKLIQFAMTNFCCTISLLVANDSNVPSVYEWPTISTPYIEDGVKRWMWPILSITSVQITLVIIVTL